MTDLKDALDHLPWTAHKHGKKDEYYVVDARDRSPVAHGLSKEAAGLIAAAPDLLEALTDLQLQKSLHPGRVESASYLWDAVHAAIAKATGRAA